MCGLRSLFWPASPFDTLRLRLVKIAAPAQRLDRVPRLAT
jgi:hypothetical protein